jgi:hypothetical protein
MIPTWLPLPKASFAAAGRLGIVWRAARYPVGLLVVLLPLRAPMASFTAGEFIAAAHGAQLGEADRAREASPDAWSRFGEFLRDVIRNAAGTSTRETADGERDDARPQSRSLRLDSSPPAR